MIRAQKNIILKDLKTKLVLLVGPRQSGKTWLAKDIANSYQSSLYLNYDQEKDRRIIKNQSWLESTELLILDELHKMPSWKNYLKGLFDTKPSSLHILVTGSARLDIYDKLGDSLAGRYFRHSLFPISLAELKQSDEEINFERLIERGGFPEPYFVTDKTDAARWRVQYINSLLSTDIFEIEIIQNMKAMWLIFNLLRSRVGSPVSYQSLAEDAAVSPTTVKKYMQILEALFIIFRITPYAKNIARSLAKEPKIYFFDTGLVQGDNGAIFENTVAVSLLKNVSAKSEAFGEDWQLQYLRTKDGLEVDFAVVKDQIVEQIIECKYSDTSISRSLSYFHSRYKYNSVQLIKVLRNEHVHGNIKILNANNFLSGLFL